MSIYIQSSLYSCSCCSCSCSSCCLPVSIIAKYSVSWPLLLTTHSYVATSPPPLHLTYIHPFQIHSLFLYFFQLIPSSILRILLSISPFPSLSFPFPSFPFRPFLSLLSSYSRGGSVGDVPLSTRNPSQTLRHLWFIRRNNGAIFVLMHHYLLLSS